MNLTDRLAERKDETGKQFLVTLSKRGAIGKATLRVLARRYNALTEEGHQDPLRAVLEEYDAGKIEPAKKATRQDNGPVLADVPSGMSPKNAILWLHQRGSLSKQQMREAAGALNAQQEAGEPFDVATALREAGALALLPEGEREAAEDDDEGDGAGEGQDEVPAALTGDVKALAGFLYNANLGPVKAAIKACEDPTVLTLAHEVERRHPSHEGGRAGALNAIEERLGELKVPEPKVE